MRSLGAGCSTRRGRCSEPPPSHLRRGAARHVDPVTYVQVSLTPRRRPGSTMLSRPCQHSNVWQHWAKRPRHTPRCPRSPRCSAALISMGNDRQHWAEWTRRGLAYESNIASRRTQESHRRDLCCVLAPSTGAAIFLPVDHLSTPHL